MAWVVNGHSSWFTTGTSKVAGVVPGVVLRVDPNWMIYKLYIIMGWCLIGVGQF